MPGILGACMIAVGCAGAGFLAAWRLEERVRLLHAFSLLLERLAGEIGFRLTPVQELSARLSGEVLRPFWRHIDEHYDPMGARTYAEVWRDAARRLELPAIDCELIGELGEILGQYDPERQARAVELVRRQLEISLESAREAKSKQGRTYGAAGVLCALLVLVLFLP